MDLQKIQDKLGHNFQQILLLKTALTHRSYMNEKDRDTEIQEHNERLEFLGDAVLELIVTDYLFNQMNEAEGLMTSLRSSLVSYKTLAKSGKNLGLEKEIFLSRGEKEELGEARDSIVADCIEAIIGALYLDGGLQASTDFIEKNILVFLPEIIEKKLYKDPKTLLQEAVQKAMRITPHYKLLSSEGKDHEKIFNSSVWIGDEKIAEGAGQTKQDAETDAAINALSTLENKIEID